ncbi:hypothetical protein LV84_03866 [Algoriphagus ratkowskyi]|uniref:Uncharacterized protein n=1 Tax=Algoriphagus ratkowskyi TaxID=57028 RepID=A0A2W7QR93_9BACT|nr:hypothetical protein LV84_03866 [Algoriphagus ratkowskyi]
MIVYCVTGANVEMHLFFKDEHTFNMGYRSEFVSINHCPDCFKKWLYNLANFRKFERK